MTDSFEEKVSLLNSYFYHIFQERFSTEKSVCTNSPLSSLNYNDLKVFELVEIKKELCRKSKSLLGDYDNLKLSCT